MRIRSESGQKVQERPRHLKTGGYKANFWLWGFVAGFPGDWDVRMLLCAGGTLICTHTPHPPRDLQPAVTRHRMGMAIREPQANYPVTPPSSEDLKIPWIILFREKNYNHEGQNQGGNGIFPQAPGRHQEDNGEIRASTKLFLQFILSHRGFWWEFPGAGARRYMMIFLRGIAACYLLLEAWQPITLLHKATDVCWGTSFGRKNVYLPTWVS